MLMVSLTSFTFSLLLLASSHPVSILGCILMQTANISLMIWLYSCTSWFSFILFLIFVGGLMVLFIYIVSLASNEKFNFSVGTITLIYIVLLMLMIFLLLSSQNLLISAEFESTLIMINKMYSYISAPLIIMTMVYLLYTLIVVVKIMENFSGPLRSTLK